MLEGLASEAYGGSRTHGIVGTMAHVFGPQDLGLLTLLPSGRGPTVSSPTVLSLTLGLKFF